MKRDLALLKHIQDCIELIEFFIKDMQTPMADPRTRDAVLRNLQVMAQSCLQLSDDVKLRHPEVQWAELRAFRNILVHEYMNIDLELVDKSLHEDLHILKLAIHDEVRKLESEDETGA